ncbi:hypothetical protein [Collimonas sp.]|uniref:hypothetical protein n=1 Tax=Collimonas sp. TaxID=1963772 RepID=UPI002CDF7E4F|nr:hypothetical protein [Collimonas sp.]HWW07588.1 hypothetical protein [Collimonas sp.]
MHDAGYFPQSASEETDGIYEAKYGQAFRGLPRTINYLAREQRDETCPPPLNVADTESLTRMAMAAASMLSGRAEGYIDVLNDMHSSTVECKLDT